jgi:hypothetical protein
MIYSFRVKWRTNTEWTAGWWCSSLKLSPTSSFIW